MPCPVSPRPTSRPVARTIRSTVSTRRRYRPALTSGRARYGRIAARAIPVSADRPTITSAARQMITTSPNRVSGPSIRCRGASTAGIVVTASSSAQNTIPLSPVARTTRTPTRTSRASRAPIVAGCGRRQLLVRRSSSPPESGIDRRDLVGVLLEHDVALDLQGRGQLAGLLGPVVRQDPEHPDRLGPGHGLVGLVDRLLYRLAQVLVVAKV